MPASRKCYIRAALLGNGDNMTVTKTFISQFGQKELDRLSPKVRELFEKIDSLPTNRTPSAEKRVASKR